MFCERCPLRQHPVMGTFLAGERRGSTQVHSLRRFGKRQIVLRQGEALEGIYCVRSGLLKRSVGNTRGNRKILEVLGPGDLIGIESINGVGCRAAEVVSLMPSELCFFRRRDLHGMIIGAPGTALVLAVCAAERARRAERALADLTLKSARERVIGAILSLGRRYGKPTARGVLLDLPVTRGDLADLAGIALATTSRLLHDLKDEGLVRTRGRQLWIVRSDRLDREHQENFDQDQEVP
jgi:CRP-like cAMP-binding protein